MGLGKRFRILSICDDEMILISRHLVLKHEGYDVESVSSKECLEPQRIKTFHIAVLCHSISTERAEGISSHLRGINEQIRIVRIRAADSEPKGTYDTECESFSGPEVLLDTLRNFSCIPQEIQENKDGLTPSFSRI